jgi:limonene-1,2-epoxide hydrolase
MYDTTTPVSRRTMFSAGALGALAAAGLENHAEAGEVFEMGQSEKANVQLIEDFCKSWGEEPTPDPQKIFSHMTEDCLWKLGTRPGVVGRAAIIEQMTKFLSGGARFNLKIMDVFARGSMVAHTRFDTKVTPDKGEAPAPGPIAGVFFIRDGKIHEWFELLITKTN